MIVEWCHKCKKFTSHDLKHLGKEGRYTTIKLACKKCGCPQIRITISGRK